MSKFEFSKGRATTKGQIDLMYNLLTQQGWLQKNLDLLEQTSIITAKQTLTGIHGQDSFSHVSLSVIC